MAIGRLAIDDGVHAGFADTLGVLAGHGHKAVTCVPHFLGDTQSGYKVVGLLCVDVAIAFGSVDFEHVIFLSFSCSASRVAHMACTAQM